MTEIKDTRPQNIWQSIEKMTELLANKGIAKDKGGVGEIKYKFRGIDDIRNATATLQKECALVISPKVTSRIETERTTKSGSFAMWVILHVDFELVNTIDASKTVVSIIGEAVDYSDKATQKAMSQAYKIFAINAFNIPTEGEEDADSKNIDFANQFITSDQAIELDLLVDEVKADRIAFLKFFKIERTDKLPATQLKNATAMLEKKRNG